MSALPRQSRFERDDEVVVMKFGGTSVQDAPAIQRLIEIVRSRSAVRPIVVVSALARVTDQLLEAGQAAASGRLGAALEIVRSIYVRHEALADLLVGGPDYGKLDGRLREEFRELESLVQALECSRELDPKAQDRLLGFGERFSSVLVCEALREAGLNAVHLDAQNCIVTDDKHGQASPIWDLTNQRSCEVVGPVLERNMIPVVGGFIAATIDGEGTTLGRGGSDFSASILGAALGAGRVEIWTDVDGVMTADPKLCPDARVIRKMSFEEAAELAHYGAKVLHPATMAPAMRENIPVYVLNSQRPNGEGTEIIARASSLKRVSAITAKRNVAAVEVSSRRGIDSVLLGQVFAAFDQQSCAVDVMAASLGHIYLLVGSAAALPEIAAKLRDVAEVKWETRRALICLVGEKIRREPEVASRAFAAVSDLDVRVLCQGASDRTISFLVEESKAQESVQRLHRAFFSHADGAPDWGGISSAFCQAG